MQRSRPTFAGESCYRRKMTQPFALARTAFAAAALALTPAVFAHAQEPVTAEVRQDRIEELERALTEQTAQNETLQRDLNAARQEITRLQSMVQDLTVVREAREAPPEGAAATPPAPTSEPRGGPSEAAREPAQQGQLGTLPATVPTGDAGQAYSAARTLLNNGQLAEADAAFTQFLADYPNAATAGDSRYWLAFTKLARNDYQPAAQGFLDYLQRYPQGPRAPEALVRLGSSLGGLQRTQQACAAFRDLPRRYPNASRDVRALATRESGRLACPA
jgi:tol-pal system protein YbgF